MSNLLENNEFTALVISFAGMLSKDLYKLIELQSYEIRVLKELLGKQPRPTKNNRCRLAILAQKISRKVLEQSEHIVTVDSFRRWVRE